MIRYIALPAVAKRITVGNYVKLIKHAKAHPTLEYPHGLTTWWPTTGAEIVQQFGRGVMERITAAVPYTQRGM